MPDASTIVLVSTDYPDRPAHRGHTVSIEGWNEEHVLLVITSDDRCNEAIIKPEELIRLAETAKAEVHKW